MKNNRDAVHFRNIIFHVEM